MRWIYAFLVFFCIFLLILPISIPFIKTSTDFSMFNTNWNGCSKFAISLVNVGRLVPVLYPSNSINFEEEGVLVIIGPDVRFSSSEIKNVIDFLENGGTLFLADDTGTSNDLLKGLGVNGRFSYMPLEDIFYSKTANFPVVVRIDDLILSHEIEKLVLNVPSAITGLEGEAFSSKVSIVGGNRRSYPVIAETRYGEGRIILLSDPDILINDMAAENEKFVSNLVKYLDSDLFYFDDAHHSDFNPYSMTTVYIHKELDTEKAFQVFALIAALIIFIESGVAMIIVQSVLRLLPDRKREDIFEGLPEEVDFDTAKRIVDEIRTGSKISDIHERRGKRVYRGAK